jgi:hypothetical protein
MPRNSDGSWTLPANSFNPAVTGTAIDPDDWNEVSVDIELGLAESRVKLTEDTTYYVRTTGNDSTGDGSANDDAHAFATPQGAYDYLLANIDAAGYFIKIKMAAGTYTSVSKRRTTDEFSADTTVLTLNALVPGASCVEFEGDGTTPTNVVWDQTTAAGTAVYVAVADGIFRFEGIALRGTGGGNTTAFFQNTNAVISWNDLDFGEFGAYHYHGGAGSLLKCFGDYTISGGAKVHVWLEGWSCWDNETHTVTITGTPDFSTCFVQIDRSSMVFEYSVTYTGSATGVRYRINDFGGVAHGGANDDLDDNWPGDTNGIVIHRAGGHDATQIIDADGAGDGIIPNLNISGRDSTAAISIARFSNDAFGGMLAFVKSRSTSRISTGSGTVPTSGDEIGRISWQGKDSTQTAHAAGIRALCRGNASSNDMPAGLQFGTTPDASGGTDTTWRWELTLDGHLHPLTDATYDIGSTSLGINDLHIGSGGVINFANNDAYIAHSSASLAFNHTTSFATFLTNGGSTETPAVQFHNSATSFSSWSNSVGGPKLHLSKSRSGSKGTYTIVQADDVLGQIDFQGADGIDFAIGGAIICEVDGTPGSNDMPGRIRFLTTPDGGGGTVTTERMRIDKAGNIVCNTAAIATNATDGFLYIPTCAGTPTGVPTSYTGRAAIVYDTTNNKLYIYDGSWLGGTTPGAFV